MASPDTKTEEDTKAESDAVVTTETHHANPLAVSYLGKLRELHALLGREIPRIEAANGTLTGDMIINSVKEVSDKEFGARTTGMAAAKSMGMEQKRIFAASAAQDEINQSSETVTQG